MEDTIPLDVSDDAGGGFGLSEADAIEALLNKWDDQDDASPSEAHPTSEADAATEEAEKAEGEAAEEPTETDAEGESAEAAEEAEPKTEPRTASDDDEVVVKVNGEETRLTVRELSRLAGQEKSLTVKAQELASERKAVDDRGMVAMAVLQKMYQRAQEEFAPYKDVDLFKLSRELDGDDFDAIRKDMASKAANVRFYESELSGYVSHLQQAQTEHIRSKSAAAIRQVREAIPDWTDAHYDEVKAYAVESGMHPDVVNGIVDPAALIMIHKARQFDKAKASMAAKKTTPAVAKVAPRPSRPSSLATAQAAVKTPVTASQDRFRKSGSKDDAIEALMARWSED